MTDSQCQICIQFEAEDICILSEMLTQITNPIADHKIPSQLFPYIFKNLKFRKCLAQIFDSKYLEICEKCSHQRLQQVFLPLFSSQSTEYNENQITQQIEEGLDKLYESIQEKQQKLKQSKEQFDRLAQQLFNCEDDVDESNSFEESSSNNEEIKLEKNDEDDQQPVMQFNKNSNKNKFQKRSIDILKKWFLDHLDNPYPDNTEKQRLSKITGMHVRQIQNWFTNSRKRYLEPLKKKFEHGLIKDSESQSDDSSKEAKKVSNKQQQQQQQQQQQYQKIPQCANNQQQQQQQNQQPTTKKIKLEEGISIPKNLNEQNNVKQEVKIAQTQLPQGQITQLSEQQMQQLQQNQFLQYQQMQQLAQLQQFQWMNTPMSQLANLQFQIQPSLLSQYQQQMNAQLLQIAHIPIYPQGYPQQFLNQQIPSQQNAQAPLPGLQQQLPQLPNLSIGIPQLQPQQIQNGQNLMFPIYPGQQIANLQNEIKK